MYRMRQKWNPAKIPKRLAESFTFNDDGAYVWYEGKTRYVCGRTTPLDQVEDTWKKKRAAIDAGDTARIVTVAAGSSTVRAAASLYYQWLNHRVKTRQPTP